MKTVSKSPISKGLEVEGARVSIAIAGKSRVDLRRSSLVEFLPSIAHDLNSQQLKRLAWDLRNHRNPEHRRQYHLQETLPLNLNHSPSEVSVVDSSKE